MACLAKISCTEGGVLGHLTADQLSGWPCLSSYLQGRGGVSYAHPSTATGLWACQPTLRPAQAVTERCPVLQADRASSWFGRKKDEAEDTAEDLGDKAKVRH